MSVDISKKNNNYRRIESLIKIAFLDIASEKHFNQISVTELCNKAKINRTTFYKHYQGVWEISSEIKKSIISKIEELTNDLTFDEYLRRPAAFLNSINEEIANHVDHYRKLLAIKGAKEIFQEIIDEFKAKYLLSERAPKAIRESVSSQIGFSLYIGGISNVYFEWFEGKIKCDIEGLPDLIRENFAPAIK